jgi:hypothetical protein
MFVVLMMQAPKQRLHYRPVIRDMVRHFQTKASAATVETVVGMRVQSTHLAARARNF